jgi:phospholipid/cholesterol/gamma-HCH transport system substrate-binding protein
MAENRAEVLAGAGVLAVAAGFFLYAAQGSGFTREADGYALTASFRSAEGINVGSDVRLAGVKVGSISALSLNPTTYFADAVVELKNDILLPTDSAILISSEGLLGGNFVEIIPGGALENLEPGAEIEDTQGAVSLITLLMKFVGGDSADAASADTASGSEVPAP